ncbi:MAG: NAD(+) diphosphatase [Pacificimonas sp.]
MMLPFGMGLSANAALFRELQAARTSAFTAAMTDIFSRAFTPAPTGFSGSMIDRVDAMRRDGEQLWAARRHPGARWLPFAELKPLVRGEALGWIRRVDVPDDALTIMLGMDEGEPRFAVALAPADLDEDALDGGAFADARGAAMSMAADQAAIVAQGRSLLDWHLRHGFCAKCGGGTEIAKAGYARECGACGAEHFPRTDPVVIMLAVDGDNCLLGRQPMFPKGFMSALAGFVEPGESLEEAVRREIYEEVGVRTARVAYVASQPWPFPSSLMVGCFAEATTTDIRLDEHELEEARWFTKDQVRAVLNGDGPFLSPPPMAIAWTLLKTWVDA